MEISHVNQKKITWRIVVPKQEGEMEDMQADPALTVRHEYDFSGHKLPIWT